MPVQPIETKPGYKTTEFYLTLATILGSLAASLAEVLPAKYAALATVLSTAIYTIVRAFAKAAPSK